MKETNHQRQRDLLQSLLGDLPPRDRKIAATLVATERRETYVLEKLVLDLNGIEPVPAYFVKPLGARGPMPAVLYNHAHGGDYVLGKDELLSGRPAIQAPPYAEELAALGCCVLCIDHWAFGERRGRSEGEIFREMLWRGQVMWGMMLHDSLRAVDYLLSRDETDSGRLATIGLSMGSTMAWWLAALDERVKVTVDLCCMTEFEEIIKSRGLELHGLYYYVPGLLKHFTTAAINELIAPRPHLCLAGNYDRLTPPAGLDIVDRALRKAYKSAGAPQAWKMLRYDTGHYETARMRAEIVQFLKARL